MRVGIVGYGNQGKKRYKAAGEDVVFTVDPLHAQSLGRHYQYLDDTTFAQDVDALIVCTPTEPKNEIVRTALEFGKHVLVEKPFYPEPIHEEFARKNGCVVYTGYNLRFEPNIIRLHDLILSGELGDIYTCRMFYGFGTAADNKGTWRDSGLGVIDEVTTHLMDLSMLFFGDAVLDAMQIPPSAGTAMLAHFELSAFDHACLTFGPSPLLSTIGSIQLEASWVSWKNTFTIDMLAEHGSAHINGLRKWGPATFIERCRTRPSGAPEERATTVFGIDNSWSDEYEHFKKLCANGVASGVGERDRRIAATINRIRSKIT